MPKIRILATTTLGAIRFAKGDILDIGEDSARHLVALGKAEVVPEKQDKDKSAINSDTSIKIKRKE